MTRYFSYAFVLSSLALLSACGTFLDTKTHSPKVDVQMRSDNGNLITPMPPALKSQGEGYDPHRGMGEIPMNRVEMNNNMQPAFQPLMPAPMLPTNYGGGIPTSDSSVTVFSLDGDIAPVAQGYVQGNSMNNSNYMPVVGDMATSYGGNTEGQIFFKHGSSRLGSGDMRKLSNVADQAKFAPVNCITVEGYASQPTQAGNQSVESHILNLKESMNRSFAVSKTLMQKGVPAEKLKTVSWGSTKASGNERQDRRVDVVMGER